MRRLALSLLLAVSPSIAAAVAPTVDVSLSGEGADDEFGWAVSVIGDVDGDLVPDLLAGAPTNDAVAGYAGRVYLFLGPITSNRMARHADATFSAEAFGDNLGVAVAGGDVNGDGVADLVMGARSNDGAGTQAGRVYLFHGPVSGSLDVVDADVTISGTQYDELGWRVVVADLNGDRYADLLLGAPNAAGAGLVSGEAAVFYGPVSGNLSITDADARFLGVLDSEEIGNALGVGDLNDDGVPDVVLGGSRFPLNGSDTGRTYVFFGPVSGAHVVTGADVTIFGEGLNDAFGASVSSGRDADGDGIDDLLVGADQEFLTGGAGKAYLFAGPLAAGGRSATTAAAVFTGETAGDRFGESVALVPGAGPARIGIGAPNNAGGGSAAGRAYVFEGAFAGTVPASAAEQSVTGAAGDNVGHVVTAGDLDGTDGDDLLFGAPSYSGTTSGEVYALFSTPPVGVDLPGAGVAAFDPRVRPNPTRGAADVLFATSRPGRVAVEVLDVAGRRVRSLAAEERAAGEQVVSWDGRADDGRRLSAGVYFVRIEAGGQAATRRVVLID